MMGSMRRYTAMDELDEQIMRLLQEDGRMPNTEIARTLGVGEKTVRTRIERMLKQGLFQVSAVPDPFKIGYQFWVFIEFRILPAHINRAAKQISQLPEIFFLGVTTGNCDLVATALFRSNEHFDDFLTRELAAVKGIIQTSTFQVVRLVKRQFRYPIEAGGEKDEGDAGED
jgi:Lrp/AsnC family transcriptional regulator, regulator for asnA, asnC and gidA